MRHETGVGAADRVGDGLRNQIASCIMDRTVAEFIRFMPRLTDEAVTADVLILGLQLRIELSAEKETLLQSVRDVLPKCCESIKRAVGEWFEEEGIQVESTERLGR